MSDVQHLYYPWAVPIFSLFSWSNGLTNRITCNYYFYQENISNYVLSAIFWGELIDKLITIDMKFFNKYIKALFLNHCDVIHSIFISVRG